MWILGLVLALIAAVVVFFLVPYSPTGAKYSRLTGERTLSAAAEPGVFTEADIAGLPLPVQRYFTYCGYLGKPKMAWLKASLENVDFVMNQDRTIKIDYRQFNLVERPERFALISSSIFGIPFEGLDAFENGTGCMSGRLGKVIPLFDQRGESMDRACLVTWLAESLLFPAAALQDFVTWEGIDDTHARADITWNGVTAGGVFTFSENGELLSFRTSDRVAIDMNGSETRADWSAYFEDYHDAGGILQPSVIKSVWHYDQGDCVYFNANESTFSISYS